jgi:hypothetical protein
MKTLIHVTLAIGALTSPTLSSAHVITVPLTRAHVYADLVRVEQAGYNRRRVTTRTIRPTFRQLRDAIESRSNASVGKNLSLERSPV